MCGTPLTERERKQEAPIEIGSLGAGRHDRSKESYDFATREVIRHVSDLRTHLHLLAFRTSFRLILLSFPHPQLPLPQKTSRDARISSDLTGRTSTAIERRFGASAWEPPAHAAVLKPPDLSFLGLKALGAFAQRKHSSHTPLVHLYLDNK